MNAQLFTIAFALYNVFFPAQSSTQVNELGDWVVQRCEGQKIDGQENDRCWQEIDWTPLTQRRMGGNIYQTKVKLSYSDKGIYFVFECQDSVITSTLKEDFANLWTEDVIEVFFWTDEDHPIYFEYELSPSNFELPILVPNFDGDFLGWRPWQYEGNRKIIHAAQIHKNEDKVTAWTGEFFIPFELLKPLKNVPPVKGTRWRANMYRIDYDSGVSTWSWKPVRTNFHDFESYGVLEFE